MAFRNKTPPDAAPLEQLTRVFYVGFAIIILLILGFGHHGLMKMDNIGADVSKLKMNVDNIREGVDKLHFKLDRHNMINSNLGALKHPFQCVDLVTGEDVHSVGVTVPVQRWNQCGGGIPDAKVLTCAGMDVGVDPAV